MAELSCRTYRIRPATTADAQACDVLCHRSHGHDRSGEVGDAIDAIAHVIEPFLTTLLH